MQFPLWIVWLLIGLLVIAGIVFLIIKLRKRKLEKDKNLSQDESRRGQDRIQKSTDANTRVIDTIAKTKEEEITQV